MSDSSAIQKRDVVTLDTTEHAKRMEAMRAVIRAAICPKGISEDEFALFMEQCKRSGLDPLLKQAFCVARRQNLGTKEHPRWADKHEFQPAEAGMLARAERFPDYRGVQASAVYAEDEISINQGEGLVHHVFNPAKRKGVLVGAWARLARDGKLPIVVWVDLSAASQSSPLWAKMPATMVEKAARVSALRKAYPEAFGGLYVAGERPDDVDTGEDEPAAPSFSKPVPAMPATTATRDAAPTLEKTPEKVAVVQFGGAAAGAKVADVVDAETVPTPPAREPGSDDGEEVDPVAADAADVCAKAKEVRTLEEYRALYPRSERFAKGTEERKRVNVALREAHSRVTGGK